MTLKRIGLAAIFIAILALGAKAPSLYQQTFWVFGTAVEISIANASETQARTAINQIAQDYQNMHQSWHAWQPSQLSDLNQAIAEGKSQQVSEDLLYLIHRSQKLSAQSEGLFNPAISQLIAAWGFHGAEDKNWRPLSDAQVQQLLAKHPQMSDLSLESDWVSSKNRAVKLDFGGIAKGYAVDIALHYLKKQGIEDAIVNAGGNLGVMGCKQRRFWHTTPWHIGIRHPNGQDILAAINTNGHEMLFSSGDYERYHEYQGKRYAHIINPKTGYPIKDITAVTVIHQNGAVADAASTALSIAGVTDAPRIAAKMGIKAYLLMTKKGDVYLSSAMAERIEFYTQDLSITQLADYETAH